MKFDRNFIEKYIQHDLNRVNIVVTNRWLYYKIRDFYETKDFMYGSNSFTSGNLRFILLRSPQQLRGFCCHLIINYNLSPEDLLRQIILTCNCKQIELRTL